MNDNNRTKIVIGNGFDLACGYKTSYKDFFTSSHFPLDEIRNYLRQLHSPLVGPNLLHCYIQSLDFNVWSLLFYLSSIIINKKSPLLIEQRDIQWCDIEEIMRLSFQRDVSISSIGSSVPVWSRVLDSAGDDSIDNVEFPLAVFFTVYQQEINNSNLYSFLYKQLKAFEKEFGKFIDEQTKERNVSKQFELINTLSFMKTDTIHDPSVDSFNYSTLINSEYHINGDTSCPIFGIDSKGIKTTDLSYPFTKTFQRLEQLETSKRQIIPFHNLVIYGHSLNEQDYNYFFPLFDYLDVFNINNDSIIVFAYSYYKLDGKTMDESKTIEMDKLCHGISGLFSAYEDYKHSSNEHRLLDILSFQGRVKIKDTEKIEGLFE